MTMATPERSINVTRRVGYRSGLLGALQGESQGKALDREVEMLNRDGYRVVFVVEDRWNLFLRLLWIIITIVTLGFISKSPNLLIIGERFPL